MNPTAYAYAVYQEVWIFGDQRGTVEGRRRIGAELQHNEYLVLANGCAGWYRESALQSNDQMELV